MGLLIDNNEIDLGKDVFHDQLVVIDDIPLEGSTDEEIAKEGPTEDGEAMLVKDLSEHAE